MPKEYWFVSPEGDTVNGSFAKLHIENGHPEKEVVQRTCYNEGGHKIGDRSGWEMSDHEMKSIEKTKFELKYEAFRRVGLTGRWVRSNYQDVIRHRLIKKSVKQPSHLEAAAGKTKKRVRLKFHGVH